MAGMLLCKAEVPQRVNATILGATPGRVGYQLLRRILFAHGTDYKDAGEWQYFGYLKQMKARDVGRERYVEHLRVEGSLVNIAPPTIVNTNDSQTIIDGDGSTVCSTVAVGGAQSGILTLNDEQKSNSGNGSFSLVSAGAWGTQFILMSSLRTEDGPSWWRSNGQRFYDLFVGGTIATFSVAHNGYSCFGKASWWYSASGFKRLYNVTVNLISETRYRVTWVNTLNLVPLSGAPRWSSLAPIAPFSEEGNTYSLLGQQMGLVVRRPAFLDSLIYSVRAPRDGDGVLQDAMDQYRVVHSNNVENASQLAKGVSDLLPLRAAMSAFEATSTARTQPLDSAVHLANSTAELYLWWRYVAKTSFNDIVDWRRAVEGGLERFNKLLDSPRRLRATKKYQVEEAGFQLQVRVAELLSVSPYPWMHAFNRMLALGFEPGLGQAWDLIPFSFVVDWFTSFSGILRAVDWHFYQALLGINVRVSSRKTWFKGQIYIDGWAGELDISYYERVPSNRRPDLKDLLPVPRSVPMKNWFPAAAALVIAR